MSDDPLIGQTLDRRYRITQRLSAGGAGIVYKAQHNRLDRPFAVKVLTGGLETDEESVARFEREARVTSRFTHPNIVEITDFGVDDTFGIYLVMEYVPGVTVKQLVNWNGRLETQFALEMAQQICSGLAAAHAQGIIHRDIKSQNIMVIEQEEDEPPIAKILDFGIAGLADGANNAERLTRTGILMGTPTYMSPEQTIGHRPDHLCDIYSFGCVFYEMLTGRPPFKGDTPFETLTMHQRQQPVVPSTAVDEADWPQMVDDLILHCLQKKKLDRPQSFKIVEAQVRDAMDALGDSAEEDDANPTIRMDLNRALEAMARGESLDSQHPDNPTPDRFEGGMNTMKMELTEHARKGGAGASSPNNPIVDPAAEEAAAVSGQSRWALFAIMAGMALLGGLAVYLLGNLLQ